MLPWILSDVYGLTPRHRLNCALNVEYFGMDMCGARRDRRRDASNAHSPVSFAGGILF